MSALRPLVDDHAQAALDAIVFPISVTTAVRDRDGRLLDFRLELVNLAAAAWAGLERGSVLGRLATELIPWLRPAGLFDELDRVVATGRPFHQHGQHYEGVVGEGRHFDAMFELMAVRHGDGYVSAWTERDQGTASRLELEGVLEHARSAVPLVRLEASATALLRNRTT